MSKTFYKITNEMIYTDIKTIGKDVVFLKAKIMEMNGRSNFNRKWLWALTSALVGGFLFLLTFLK